MPFLKKNINGNQRATWQVEVGPRGDTPPINLTFTNNFLYEVTHFYKNKLFLFLLWKMALESVLKKIFSHNGKFSLLDDNKGWISISLPRKCTFSDLFLIFRDRTRSGEKSIHISKRVATQK
jgi:hypothetical protein